MAVPEILCRGFTLEVTVAGTLIDDALAARASFSMGQKYARATFASTVEHGDFLDTVLIDAGVTEQFRNGSAVTPLGLIGRFSGQRSGPPRFDLWPRAVLHECAGELWKADRYVNFEDPAGFGGLRIDDLVGHGPPAPAGDIVKAVLTKAGCSYSAADIHDSGAIYGGQVLNPEAVFLWPAGTPTEAAAKWIMQTRGETGLDHIGRYDRIDAVVTRDLLGEPISGGFYRTFESISGTIYRQLVGGRPRDAIDHVFVEEGDGANILEGSTVSREPPTANRVFVEGYDYGTAGGPVWAEETGSSVYFPTPVTLADAPSSPMIEKALAADAGTGMDCQTVAAATFLETLRITPRSRILTPDDAEIGIGQTHLVAGTAAADGSGATVGRLGTGEKLWADALDISIDLLPNGAPDWLQTVQHVGGGAPDTGLPGVGL